MFRDQRNHVKSLLLLSAGWLAFIFQLKKFFLAFNAFLRVSWAPQSSTIWKSKLFSISSALAASSFHADLFVLSRNFCLLIVKFSLFFFTVEMAASTLVFYDIWIFLSTSSVHRVGISMLISSIFSCKISVSLATMQRWSHLESLQAWRFLERCYCRVPLPCHSKTVGMTFAYLCFHGLLAR